MANLSLPGFSARGHRANDDPANGGRPDGPEEMLMEGPTAANIRPFDLIVFKYRLLITLTTLATVFGTCFWLWLRSDSYETSAKVMIKFAREQGDPRTSVAPGTTKVVSGPRPDIYTEAELIKSYALVDQVVTVLNLDHPPPPVPPPGIIPRVKFELRRVYHGVQGLFEDTEILLALKERLTPREAAIVEIIKGLKVETVKDSSIINVTLALPVKQGAGLVLNTLLRLYSQNRLAMQSEPNDAVFFQSQASEFRNGVMAKEEELAKLKNKYDITELREELSLNLKNLSDAQKALEDSEAAMASEQARVDLLQQRLAKEKPNRTVSETSSRNTQLDVLNEKRSQLEIQKQGLLGKYTSNSPQVQSTQSQIDRIDQLLASAVPRVEQSETTALNATYLEVEKEYLNATQGLAASKARRDAEAKTVGAYEARMKELRDVEVTYDQLSRDLVVTDETYQVNEKNALSARAADAMSLHGISSIEIVDPAVDPILPAGIKKTYLVGGALGIGLILALSLAYLADSFDHSLSAPEEVERIFPGRVWGLCLEKTEEGADLSLSPANQRQVLAIASSVERVDGHSPVTSFLAASPEAGATTTVNGVAHALASRFGKKTLIVNLVDASTSSGKAGDLNGLNQKMQPLNFNLPMFIPTRINPNLDQLTAFSLPANWPQKDIAEQVDRLPEQFSSYEHILIDMGFDLVAHRRLGVAMASSGIVIVTEARKTRWEALEQLREEFADGLHVLGVVLNQRRLKLPTRPYALG